jgi:hypothetical protein
MWRVNALVIFAVGIAGVLVLSLAAFMFLKETMRVRQVDSVVNVDPEDADTSRASLGNFSAVTGSSMLRAPLFLDQAAEYSHVSKVASTVSSIQNYLYFDPASHAFHWLLPGNRRLILESTELSARDPAQGEVAVVYAIVHQLVDSDTNGDGKLAGDDLKTVAVGDPNGLRFARVLSKVERLNGAHLIDKTRLVLLYTAGGELRSAEIDLASDKIIRESAMNPIKQELPR